MTPDEQVAWDSYASNLQASMNRHPAGKRIAGDGSGTALPAFDASVDRVGTPIHDGLVLEQYEQPPTPNRYASALAATYGLFILAFILLWVLS
jgi:hypothetical protein